MDSTPQPPRPSPPASPLTTFEVELRCSDSGFPQGSVEIQALDSHDASTAAADLYPGCYAAEVSGPQVA